jgi:hypothetical protein
MNLPKTSAGTVSSLLFAFVLAGEARAGLVLNLDSLRIHPAAAARISLKSGPADELRWESSDPKIAQVFQNGFVVGLKPGQARVTVRRADASDTAQCLVTVTPVPSLLADPSTLKQYPDDRSFTVGGRKCFGSELNGQRASDPAEKRFTRSNRVINPKPLRADKPLDWELLPNAEVFDGAGILMGTVPPSLKVGDRTVPVSMFNFGAGKVIGGRVCLYAFSVSIKPSPAAARSIDSGALAEGRVAVSAWLPLDGVADKETLLGRIGLGRAGLPALPLETTGRRVTGGDPKLYMTQFGELSIVRQVATGPVPSHYLRRPGGTINLVYSVPGFGLGGQGTDSFLVGDALEFYPAKGAKVFHQPTYYPSQDPRAGQVSPQTMTFLYGAIKCNGDPPVYGWIAQEALAP